MASSCYGYATLAEWQWSKDCDNEIVRRKPLTAAHWRTEALAAARSEAKAQLLSAQRYRCHYCRCEIEDNLGFVEIDHVIPKDIAPQFSYTTYNLVLSCKRCNSAKGKVNPTSLSSEELQKRSVVPTEKTEYIWIHPYIHCYSDHITIREDCLYEGKDDIGQRVIEVCKLSKTSEVLARRRRAIVLSSQDDVSAIFRLIGKYPDLESSEVADLIVEARGYPAERTSSLIEAVAKLRSEGHRLRGVLELASVVSPAAFGPVLTAM